MNFSLALKIGERADALLDGNAGIGCMELIEIDAFGLERAQACLACAAKMLGPPVALPTPAGAHASALGGNHHSRPPLASQRLGNQPLVVAGLRVICAVGIGGVDEVDAELVDHAL